MPPLSSPLPFLLLLHPNLIKLPLLQETRSQGVEEQVKIPPQQKVPICERERARKRDLRLSPRAQLGLSVEFRNGMLTAHPDLSSSSFSSSSCSSSCTRRRGPKTTTISSQCSSDFKDDSTGCLSLSIQLQREKKNASLPKKYML